MLIILEVQTVAVGSVKIAIDPGKVACIRPAPMEPDVSYLEINETNWRVNSSFEDLVDKINKARKEIDNG
jgi:hypothetical protein